MTQVQSALQFVRHTGIAAAFLQPDLEGEFIAPVGPELEDLHGVHMNPGAVSLEPHAHDGSWSGQHAFQGFRYRPDGSENPDFVLNQAPFRDASILVAGRNFGQGSLQAYGAIRLRQCGFHAIIAPSFGPVFYDDCFDFGLLPVTLDEEAVQGIAEQIAVRPRVEMTVDLVAQTITRQGMEPIRFEIDARRKVRLLSGSTPLDERLEHSDSAAEMRRRDQQARPWIYDTGPDRSR